MIKFTEIFSVPDRYDPELEKVVEDFGVREVFLNPDYIISAKENIELFTKAQKAELVEGLKKEVIFTQIFLNIPGRTAQQINIIGDPEHIAKRMKRDR